MKIDRIKKSFVAHGIEHWIVLSVHGFTLQKPMVRIAFYDGDVFRNYYSMFFCSYAEAYRYCKEHGLLSLSRRERC